MNGWRASGPRPRARVSVWGAAAALGLGLRLWAQAPAAPAKAAGGWQSSAAVTQGVNSNIFMSTTHPTMGATTEVRMSLARHWMGPRSSFSVLYAPAGALFAGHTELNYLAQSGAANWTYQWRHTSFVAAFHAERMPERAGGLQAGLSGVAGVANASQATALAAIMGGAGLDLSLQHQYSLRSSWSASLDAGMQSFTQDKKLLAQLTPGGLAASANTNSRSVGGSLGWSYQMGPRSTFSLSFGQNQILYVNPSRRLLYTNLQATLTQQLSSNVSAYFGGGPAWNRTPRVAGEPAILPGQSYSANAGLIVARGASHYGATWSHAEQVGYVPGGVATDTVALDYGLTWDRFWSSGFSFGRSRFSRFAGAAAGAAAGGESSNFLAGSLAYRLARGWALDARATFMTQAVPVAVAAGVTAMQPLRRAQFSLGLQYQPGGAR